MATVHQITGYDEKTDRFVLGHDIPIHLLNDVKGIVGVGSDDPDAVETYPLTDDHVAQIQALIRCPEVILNGVKYYLEAYLPVIP